ncbi:hypothetical protein IPA_08520 [Ignicoccus pacificus DSM 13166]|uniref:DNA repair protein n=1 Tax=Ignicoccus pacificus DSM 13166 TaxID=940294 RepID=A0A977KA23_9CREN|nr:hypothetical protein IPA_08520 [Ignicoccus pacificus DSM 13166]
MKRIDPELCARCKGYKRLCGLPNCPILQRFRAYKSAGWEEKEPEGPTPPSPIVGERGYPKVPVSLGLSPYGDPKLRDDPYMWIKMNLKLEDIARLRMEMLNPFKRFDARRPWELLKGEILWGAISEKPVDVEAEALGKPKPPSLDGLLAPLGPSVKAEKVKVTSNPKVDPLIERRASERIKAEEALRELFEWGRDPYLLIKAFSLGMFGRKKRLVPTRWAITAVDQTLSKFLKENILKFSWIDGFKVGRYSHLGNTYTVILKPGPPSVEMFEIWKRGSLWSSEKDVLIYNIEYSLPTSKAMDPSDGGFHAIKHGVLKALYEKRVSASVIVIREIDESYYMPLGVWQVREGARLAALEALSSPNLNEKELGEVVNEKYLSSSRLLRTRGLSEYIK